MLVDIVPAADAGYYVPNEAGLDRLDGELRPLLVPPDPAQPPSMSPNQWLQQLIGNMMANGERDDITVVAACDAIS